MKIYQSFVIIILLLSTISQSLSLQQQDMNKHVEQKQPQSIWKKTAQWFGALGLAAVGTVVMYQGVQYGYGRRIESTYAEKPVYKKYKEVWEKAKESDDPTKVKVAGLLFYALKLEDVDVAEQFLQAQEGYIFAHSKIVQDELNKRREAIKAGQARRQQAQGN